MSGEEPPAPHRDGREPDRHAAADDPKPTAVDASPHRVRSDDADRFNAIALRDGAVPAAAGASSMPPEDQLPPAADR